MTWTYSGIIESRNSFLPMCQESVVKLFDIVAFTHIADNTIITMSGLFVGLIASFFMTQENEFELIVLYVHMLLYKNEIKV